MNKQAKQAPQQPRQTLTQGSRAYTYVGPSEIKERSQRGPDCLQVRDAELLLPWLRAFLPRGRTQGEIPVTFIIDPEQELWIADRRSEHVACADGGDVLAAGEMIFSVTGMRVEVVEITNQSTGYCPEPESWGMVAAVLDHLGIPHPDCFTAEFHFRRCDHCQTITLIKEGVFECAVCNSPLPPDWNFATLS